MIRDVAPYKLEDHLIDLGRKEFKGKPKEISFTPNKPANALINDIQRHPHAYVLGCIADRQVKSEVAWEIPYKISQKLGGFGFHILTGLKARELRSLVRAAGHRFWNNISKSFYAGIKRIEKEYHGDASRIWADRPSSAELVYRFLEFNGIGPKIATMAANILSRDFKIILSDYYSIDISVDRHIQMVFKRLKFVPMDASPNQIIYRARAIHPEHPGLLDYACFKIGKTWCKPNKPDCLHCEISRMCPTFQGGKIPADG